MILNSSGRVDIAPASGTRIGDPNADYAQFGSDGVLTLEGAAQVYLTSWIPAQAIRAPGVKPATYVDLGISGAWEFADGQEETIVCNIQIPERTLMTADLYLWMGWSSPTVSQDCDWEFAYLLRQLGEDTTAAAQQTLQTFAESSSVANGFVFTIFTIVAAQLDADDKCLHINIMRDGNDAGDTLGAAAHLHGMCLKYKTDKRGSAI